MATCKCFVFSTRFLLLITNAAAGRNTRRKAAFLWYYKLNCSSNRLNFENDVNILLSSLYTSKALAGSLCLASWGRHCTFPRYIFRLRSKIRQPRGQNAKLYRLAAFYPASNNVYYSTSINAKETGVIRRLIRWTHRKCFSLLQSATPKSSSFIQGDSFLLPSTRHCFIKSYIPRGMVRQPYISLLITALLYTQLLSNTKY